MGRREEKKLMARQSILDAAAKIFKTRGFMNTSVSDIMCESNLGVGTFYNYFHSKEEVLMELLTNLFAQVEKNLTFNENKFTPLELLEICCMDTAKMIDENRFILPLFTSVGVHSDKPENIPDNLSPKFKNIFQKIILRGQINGDIRCDIPADLILGMFHSIFQAAAFSKLEISFQENISLKIKILLRGIRG